MYLLNVNFYNFLFSLNFLGQQRLKSARGLFSHRNHCPQNAPVNVKMAIVHPLENAVAIKDGKESSVGLVSNLSIMNTMLLLCVFH